MKSTFYGVDFGYTYREFALAASWFVCFGGEGQERIFQGRALDLERVEGLVEGQHLAQGGLRLNAMDGGRLPVDRSAGNFGVAGNKNDCLYDRQGILTC